MASSSTEVEQIITDKIASQYRKELTLDKTVRGDLTSMQREFRERKLAAYDEKMKATGKRGLYLGGKWSKKLDSIKKDTEAIKGTTQAILEDRSFGFWRTSAPRNSEKPKSKTFFLKTGGYPKNSMSTSLTTSNDLYQRPFP